MRIANNVNAQYVVDRLSWVRRGQEDTVEKLASGLRINSSGDDAAGLSISEKMRAQIHGLQMAEKNAMDGLSLIQTADGAMGEMHSILQRMRELTVQAGNDTLTPADRENISREVSRLIDETTKIMNQTEFNTKKIFKGLDDEPITLQIGADEGTTIDLFIKKSSLPRYAYFAIEAGGLVNGPPETDVAWDLSTSANAELFREAIDKAIADVSTERAQLGAKENRLNHTLANIRIAAENLTAAESRIRDADLASEMMQFTKKKIIGQASTAMLAQANQAPQGVLQLLR
ncbi:MAG TPA: flagellin [Bacillota bacterium]|nr:flagellin [Bacillota bacterium]